MPKLSGLQIAGLLEMISTGRKGSTVTSMLSVAKI